MDDELQSKLDAINHALGETRPVRERDRSERPLIPQPMEQSLAEKFRVISEGAEGRAILAPRAETEVPTGKPGGIYRNLTAGANEDIATGLSLVPRAGAWGMNQIYKGLTWAADMPEHQEETVFTPKNIKSAMGRIGANPDDVGANTIGERAAREAGSGATFALIGAGAANAAEGAKEVGRLIDKGLTKIFGGEVAKDVAPAASGVIGNTAKQVFGQPGPMAATIGATSGVGGALAKEAVDEPYKPYAGLGGSLLGGTLPMAVQAGVHGLRGLTRAATDYLRPTFNPEAAAGQKLGREASNLPAVKNALEDQPASGPGQWDQVEKSVNELIPGSKPTTFQQTGDLGLGQLERRVRTATPAPFSERVGEQNRAQTQALKSVQPDGSPQDTAQRIRSIRELIEQSADDVVSRADTAANALRGTLEKAGFSHEQHGDAMRKVAQDARDTAREAERKLWGAVDPKGTLIMAGDGIATEAKAISSAKNVPKSAAKISGEEKAIFTVAKSYKDTVPFREVTALSSRLGEAMRTERETNGVTESYRRMTQLRVRLDKAIDSAVEDMAAKQKELLANQGKDSKTSVLDQWMEHFYGSEGFKGKVAGRPEGDGVAPGGIPDGNVPPKFDTGPGVTEGAVLGKPPRKSGIGWGPPDAAGRGGPPKRMVPLDDAAGSRLDAASAATRARKGTFDEGPVGDILKSGKFKGTYDTSSASVPGTIFHPGPTGGEGARAYLTAAGDKGIGPLTDSAAFSLHAAARRPDGSLDPAAIERWVKAHGPALAELPGSSARFSNVASAERAVAEASANRKAQLDQFDKSQLGRLAGLHEEGDITRTIGTIFGRTDGAKAMGELAAHAATDESAKRGLRRAVVDHIMTKFVSSAESGTTGINELASHGLQQFIRTKSDVLAKAGFSKEEMNLMERVAEDIQRANRSVNSKIKGTPGTAQDVRPFIPEGLTKSILGKVAVESLLAGGSYAASHAVGYAPAVVGYLGAQTMRFMHEAGIKNVNELIAQAMLDPAKAKFLLQKAPERPDLGTKAKLGQSFRQLLVNPLLQTAPVSQ